MRMIRFSVLLLAVSVANVIAYKFSRVNVLCFDIQRLMMSFQNTSGYVTPAPT